MIDDTSHRPSTYLPDAEWSFRDVLLVFLAGFAGSAVGFILASTAQLSEFAVIAAGLALQAFASLGTAAILSSQRGTGDWERDFGLRIEPRHTVWIAAGFGLQIVVALLIGPIVELLAPEDAPQQSIADVAENLEGGAPALVFMFLVVIVAPLVEELIFRGMLLSRLRRSMGPKAAITASAAVFSGVHLIDPNAIYAVPGLFLVGLALGWAALRFGSLSVPIFLHAGVNLTGAVFLFLSDELLESVDAVIEMLP